MSFLAFCARSFLACCIPVIALFAGVTLTGNAIQKAQITAPPVDGFAGLLLVLSMAWACRFYPQANIVTVVFEGGFAEAHRAWKWTFKITLMVVVLMALPEGFRQYGAASREAFARSADSVFAGAICAALWQFSNQLWYRLLFPGLLALPIGAGFAVRALMKDAHRQRQSRAGQDKPQ